jgi:hypothetical protein
MSSKKDSFLFLKERLEMDFKRWDLKILTCSDRVAIHRWLRWQSAAAAAAAASLGLDIEYNEPVPAGSSLLPFMFLHCFCSY